MEDIITQHPTVTKGEAHQFFQAFYDHYHSMRHQLVASAAKLDGSHAEVFEDLGPIGKSMLSNQHSWMFGIRSITVALEAQKQLIDAGGELSPLDFLNWMYTADRLPLVKAQALAQGVRLPKPDPSWIGGWLKTSLLDGLDASLGAASIIGKRAE